MNTGQRLRKLVEGICDWYLLTAYPGNGKPRFEVVYAHDEDRSVCYFYSNSEWAKPEAVLVANAPKAIREAANEIERLEKVIEVGDELAEYILCCIDIGAEIDPVALRECAVNYIKAKRGES